MKLISENKILTELNRIAGNCQFYKGTGDRERFLNEAGCLRGMMTAADAIGLVYLKQELYENYIKPAHDMMNQA